MTTVATTVGKFVWHDHVSDDPKQAQSFYAQLFGWHAETYPGSDYSMISSGGAVHGGYATAGEGAPPPHWLSHVHVERLEDTIERAKEAGGRLAAGPFDMGEIGRTAIVADPQGAYLSVYQPGSPDQASAEGVFVWDELGTSDVDSAQEFYERVLGWTTADMGAEYGGYRVFNRGETGVAGVMANPDGSIPPHWQPYVYVEDPDATVAKAVELGGAALAGPMDVPKVGRIAVLRDAQGAVFGIIRPDPAM